MMKIFVVIALLIPSCAWAQALTAPVGTNQNITFASNVAALTSGGAATICGQSVSTVEFWRRYHQLVAVDRAGTKTTFCATYTPTP